MTCTAPDTLHDVAYLVYVTLAECEPSRGSFLYLKRCLEWLTPDELEVVRTLALDYWQGTFEELINAAKELA